jgi:hypothetical protein
VCLLVFTLDKVVGDAAGSLWNYIRKLHRVLCVCVVCGSLGCFFFFIFLSVMRASMKPLSFSSVFFFFCAFSVFVLVLCAFVFFVCFCALLFSPMNCDARKMKVVTLRLLLIGRAYTPFDPPHIATLPFLGFVKSLGEGIHVWTGGARR